MRQDVRLKTHQWAEREEKMQKEEKELDTGKYIKEESGRNKRSIPQTAVALATGLSWLVGQLLGWKQADRGGGADVWWQVENSSDMQALL